MSDTPILCVVYVDDIQMTSPMKENIDKYIELLKKEFTLTITILRHEFEPQSQNW